MDGPGPAKSSSATTIATQVRSSRARKRSPWIHEQLARTVVEDKGVHNTTCEYCTSRSSVTHTLWANSLTVQDYQELLDRGWLRSGMFLSKPRMKNSCCPQYTIRLNAASFVPTKFQRCNLTRMLRYLEGKLDRQTVGEVQEEKDDTSEKGKGLASDNHLASTSDRNSSSTESLPVDVQPDGNRDIPDRALAKEEVVGRLKAATETALKECVECGSLWLTDLPTVHVNRIHPRLKQKLKDIKDLKVDYICGISFVVMKRSVVKREVLRDENIKEKRRVFSDMTAEEIAEVLVGKMSELKDTHSFTVKACSGYIFFNLSGSNISSVGPLSEGQGVFPGGDEKMLSNYDHKKWPSSSVLQSNSKPPAIPRRRRVRKRTSASSSSVLQSNTKPLTIPRKWEFRMRRSSFDAEEFALYKSYRVRVHNDHPEDVTELSYWRLLLDTPLIFVPPVNDGTSSSCGFGSFHQQYLLDGKLVAVGVMDILPHCISSKYRFWDADFAFLDLKTYSKLQEIKWVQQEAKTNCPSLQYYYLGFYVHSCPKIRRYKASYHPSELLCPERFSWVPYEIAVPFLDKQAYVCLSDIAHLKSPESAIPRIASEQGTVAASAPSSQEEDNATEVVADFSQFEDPEKGALSSDLLLEGSHSQIIVNNSSGPLANIQLYINDAGCISFEDLKQLLLNVPQSEWNFSVHNLNRYLQAVGPSLASRMAYLLL